MYTSLLWHRSQVCRPQRLYRSFASLVALGDFQVFISARTDSSINVMFGPVVKGKNDIQKLASGRLSWPFRTLNREFNVSAQTNCVDITL
jgi:hypothetical protein